MPLEPAAANVWHVAQFAVKSDFAWASPAAAPPLVVVPPVVVCPPPVVVPPVVVPLVQRNPFLPPLHERGE